MYTLEFGHLDAERIVTEGLTKQGGLSSGHPPEKFLLEKYLVVSTTKLSNSILIDCTSFSQSA